MRTLPVTLILLAAATLGTILLLHYLKGRARRPGMLAAHLILGAAALEQMAMLLRGTPDGEGVALAGAGKLAAGLIAVAMGLGFATPLVRHSRSTMNTMLTGHVTLAAAGCVLFLAWVTGL
jgi:hypothetical protein